jgi:hypothetical protein
MTDNTMASLYAWHSSFKPALIDSVSTKPPTTHHAGLSIVDVTP